MSTWGSKKGTHRSRVRRGAVAVLAAVSMTLATLTAVAPAEAATGGNAVGWGENTFGKANPPNPPGSNTFYVDISAGGDHSLGLTNAGTVVGWGNNAYGQTTVPNPPSGTTYTEVAAGADHSLAVASNGAVRAWGRNNAGQTNVPNIPAGTKFVDVAAGGDHSLGLTDAGTVIAWGSNADNESDDPSGNRFVQVAAGRNHSLALTDNGTIVAWGSNSVGQTNVPTLPAGTRYVQIAAGGNHSLALTDAGTVRAWGSNGDGESNVPTFSPGTRFTQVAAGARHSLALTDAGNIVGWGDNSKGQRSVPDLPQGRKYTQVAAGAAHSLALTGGVADTTPPVVQVTVTPDRVLQGLTATATFTASDLESGIASTTCEPSSAVDTSALGSFTVTCAATNGQGLTATATDTYRVISARFAIRELHGDLWKLLPNRFAKKWGPLLREARKDLRRGDSAEAIGDLAKFIRKVRVADARDKIGHAAAVNLVGQANLIIDSIQATSD